MVIYNKKTIEEIVVCNLPNTPFEGMWRKPCGVVFKGNQYCTDIKLEECKKKYMSKQYETKP